MRIAVLMGSPRKKDSYQICKTVEATMCSADMVFNYIFLKEYYIKDCRGCGLCFSKGERYCPCKDDLSKIKSQLESADGIIFATPVYAYQVPAPLKKVIDRLSFLFHRQSLVGKPALIVVTSDGGGHKEVSQYMKMTATGWGCKLVGRVSVVAPLYFEDKEVQSAWVYSEKYHQQTAKKIEHLTNAFRTTIESKIPIAPSFYELFMFNCLRSKTFTSQIDYQYWHEKGWLKSNFFYEVQLSPLKKIFGMVLKALVNFWGRKLKNNIDTRRSSLKN